ncbi:membrane protein [Hylemonella gracilis str. Niagara R]|uniref:Membrane protein n=1 Tax=Hylemonella gracilis str. Niagara R TaxID=1458275 RepID=A0A016XG85_9BURK|nr:restriction endonuclease [Hylemonella gracilis]EYC50233.1 membrane protein [Hylemonella gracilis str. Niagara R]
MKLKMAKNSLFAILLRSRWWISLLIGLLLTLISVALLPDEVRVVGALSGLPFFVIAIVAAIRQWGRPSPERVAQIQDAIAALSWPAFANLLEQAFVREGHTVQRGKTEDFDFELERQGRRTLVSARRWKSARTGVENLRALQAAREARTADEALYIGLAPLSEQAQPYATAQGIQVWQAEELALALHDLALPKATGR